MPGTTDQLIEVMEALVAAQQDARATLATNEELLRQGIDALRSGADVQEALAATPAGAQRQVTQEVLDRLMAARHTFRLHVIAACVECGMTPRQIAEEWGMSRQRVDQFVQEAKRGPV